MTKMRNFIKKIIKEENENDSFFDKLSKYFNDNGCKIKTHNDRQVVASKELKTNTFYFNIQYRSDLNMFDAFFDCKIEVDKGRSLADPTASYQTTSARTGVKFKKLKNNVFKENEEDIIVELNKFLTKINKIGSTQFKLYKS